MKYIDAEKLTKAIEDKGLNCSFALKMERLDTLALIDELQQEQPEPSFLTEKAIVWFNNIAESAKKLSAGNVSHLAPTIAGMAIRSAEFLEKRKQEQPEVDIEKCKKYDEAVAIAKAWYKASGSSPQERNVARMIMGDIVMT